MTDVLRQEIAALATTLVVKVGTQVLTRDDGQLNQARIDHLARQLHDVVASGRKVVLVSSGAVGAGMGRLGMTQRPTDLPRLQAVAAIGQSLLVEAYERALSPYGHHAAQVLLTAEDLEHRPRYLNARNTLLTLLELGAIPIINENDTVSVEELHTTFGDNDRLAAIVTNLIRAPLLVLLSDVDGLCDGDPRQAGSKIIQTVERLDRSVYDLVCDQTGGRGKGRHGQQAGSGPALHQRRRKRDHRQRPRSRSAAENRGRRARRHACFLRKARPWPPANAGSALP